MTSKKFAATSELIFKIGNFVHYTKKKLEDLISL